MGSSEKEHPDRKPTWEILRGEFLKPKRMSVYALAKRLRVPAPRINDTVVEKPGTADTAVRLSRFPFGTTELLWLNLEGAYGISRVKAEHNVELNPSEATEQWRSRGFELGLGAIQIGKGRFPSGRGHRARTVVEIPPRGRNSPFTSAQTGLLQRTTSSSTRLTIFS